ncbi:VWA domain-containing protein [Magnetospirillum sulfuroxidans]|uniref:VWA domain-containing protein n=1 Tax=Magnetospirillum sulfuroxidans TaxID=611300 RepID=A0ABS5IEQ9_9PROT|nr:VWA domain-containing protein [Magnetospirillum sulfuroxidans]MBR9972896.1 VWA domain-containing protein [Magnetospirillum sulfuroxidans]
MFDQMTPTGFCDRPECAGVGYLVEVISEDENPALVENSKALAVYAQAEADENRRAIGLASLFIDRSPSVFVPVAPPATATRADLFVASAAGGIFDLRDISNPMDAYVAVVTFSSDLEVVLFASLEEIFSRFTTPADLAAFLSQAMRRNNNGTNINLALNEAKRMRDRLVSSGDLSPWGGPKDVKPIMHTTLTDAGGTIVVPNYRCVLLSDGEHNGGGALANPFAGEGVDPLITSYFGDVEDAGAIELQKAASFCPEHNARQFFAVTRPQQIASLRGLFKMASASSGFCPMCVPSRSTTTRMRDAAE